jgi:LAO/AO transport system kinase
MDAAGMDYVLIETVGVGQDEIAVAALAQVTVVVLVPGMGDDIQAIKAGIMEIADIFVINKSDHPGADRLALELHAEAFTCPVIRTVATEGKGIAELLAAITPKAPLPNGRGSVSRSSLTEPRPSGSGASPTLDHLGIAVPNLDAALPFYQSLGLTPHREEVPAEKVRLAMLPVSNARLELLEPTSPDSPISNFLTKRGPGLHHIALRVPDLAATVAALKASGVRLLNDPRPGAGGHIYVFVHPASTGGVLLELIQEHST